MASADELLRDAQFAFQNIGAGSTDERKYTARAQRIAKRIVRAYPDSIEATQARSILHSLGIAEQLQEPGLASALLKKSSTHIHQFGKRSKQAVRAAPSGDDWASVWQRFAALPYLRKRIFLAIVAFLILLISFTPFLLLFVVFYVYKPALVKQHTSQLLTILHPEASGR